MDKNHRCGDLDCLMTHFGSEKISGHIVDVDGHLKTVFYYHPPNTNKKRIEIFSGNNSMIAGANPNQMAMFLRVFKQNVRLDQFVANAEPIVLEIAYRLIKRR